MNGLEQIVGLSKRGLHVVQRVESAYQELMEGGSPDVFRNTVAAALGTLSQLRQAISGHDGGGDGMTIGSGGVLIDVVDETVGGEQVLSYGAYGR